MQGLSQRVETASDSTQKDSFGTTFLKKSPICFFLNLMLKASFVPQCTLSIKLRGVQFQSQIQLWDRIELVDDYC